MRSLHLVSPMQHGSDVRLLQEKLGITVDGQYGPLTAKAVRRSKYARGFPSTALDTGATAYYLQILYGERQPPADYAARSRSRKQLVEKRAKVEAQKSRLAAKALAELGHVVGQVEHPAGSNRGPGFIDTCQLNAGHGHFRPGEDGWPWCGCAVHEAYKRAGVELPGEIRSVGWLYSAAHSGHPKFELVSLHDAVPGDILILFGPNTHMGLLREKVTVSNIVQTREGNTSPGPGGSQDNGGGIHDRARHPTDIVAIIHVR